MTIAMKLTAEELIDTFQMDRLPGEGGWFKETYRARGKIPWNVLEGEHGGARNYSTGIYYMLRAGEKSLLHRIKSDEMWHFYAGDPLMLVEIAPSGAVTETILGNDLGAGHTPQYVVPAGHWFGAYPNVGSVYAFVGCTVAPGFEFEDFELGERSALLAEFPDAKTAIERLTAP